MLDFTGMLDFPIPPFGDLLAFTERTASFAAPRGSLFGLMPLSNMLVS